MRRIEEIAHCGYDGYLARPTEMIGFIAHSTSP